MRAIAALAAALIAVLGQAQNQGPFGYYLSSGETRELARYDGGTLSVFATSGGNDYPIAVSGDIRTKGSGQSPNSDHGGLYDLNGNWLSTDYAGFDYDGFNHLFYDGATDGSRHFLVNYGLLGGVYSTDRNWGNMTKLFDLGGFSEHLGITYDVQRGTLWIADYSPTARISEYDLSGRLLSSFDSGLGNGICALAMDYSDNTLWMGRTDGTGVYHHFDRTGNFLGSFQNNVLANMNTLGGEFNVVPEPASILAIAVGLAALRKKRQL